MKTWLDLPLTAVTWRPCCLATACDPGVSSGGWLGCCSDGNSPHRLYSWRVFHLCGSWSEPSRHVCIWSVFHKCSRNRAFLPCGSCCGPSESICPSSFSHRCYIYRPCCHFHYLSRPLERGHRLHWCSLFCLISALTSPLRLHQTPCTPHPPGVPESRKGSEREAAHSGSLPQRELFQSTRCPPASAWAATSPDCCRAPPAPLWPAAPVGCCSSPGSRQAGPLQRLVEVPDLQGQTKLRLGRFRANMSYTYIYEVLKTTKMISISTTILTKGVVTLKNFSLHRLRSSQRQTFLHFIGGKTGCDDAGLNFIVTQDNRAVALEWLQSHMWISRSAAPC